MKRLAFPCRPVLRVSWICGAKSTQFPLHVWLLDDFESFFDCGSTLHLTRTISQFGRATRLHPCKHVQ
uniref:Uncharacterized protein n=1 Tax=Arundo donax TaxID=35708 RepID=A0A0A8XWH4_ARUDO